MSAEELQEKLKISDPAKSRRVSSKKNLDDELKHTKARKVLIAVDGSDNGRHALQCKYKLACILYQLRIFQNSNLYYLGVELDGKIFFYCVINNKTH